LPVPLVVAPTKDTAAQPTIFMCRQGLQRRVSITLINQSSADFWSGVSKLSIGNVRTHADELARIKSEGAGNFGTFRLLCSKFKKLCLQFL